MVDKICNFLTNKIKEEDPKIDEEKAEIIHYGIELMVGEIPKIFIMIAIAYLLGVRKTYAPFLFYHITISNLFRWISFKNTHWLYYLYNCYVYRNCIFSTICTIVRRNEIYSYSNYMVLWNNNDYQICTSRYRECTNFSKKRKKK